MGSRRLPHIYPTGKDLFVTCHLNGSLPRARYPPPTAMKAGEAFVWMDRYLDRTRTGPMWLGGAEAAGIVESRVLQEPGCLVHAYVIMANHIHLLMTPRDHPAKVMQSIKGGSARKINLMFGNSGSFWQRESYDHWVRDSEEWRRIKNYIEYNPVAAGLVEKPNQYRWSSAWRGARFSELARP